MPDRKSSWISGAILVGLVPLLIAYLVRYYYLGQRPALPDVLGMGDGMLVAVSWSVGALLDLPGSTLSAAWRSGVKSTGLVVVMLGSVAYGCLTADSVTGRVQTGWQEQVVTWLSVVALVVAATIGIAATGGRCRPKGDTE